MAASIRSGAREMGAEKEWLSRFSAPEWISAAMRELRQAEDAYQRRSPKGGLTGARRAAGMALNAVLVLETEREWGRTYMDHLAALEADDSAPARVRECAKVLSEPPDGGARLVLLRTAKSDDRILEAARDIIAHAYAVLAKHGGRLG